MRQLAVQIERVASRIVESNYVVAFTGLGIATQRAPSALAPNASHLALVELARLGKLQFLITQTIDNLHRESGFPQDRLVELHGNNRLLRCLSCGQRYTYEEAGWDAKLWGRGERAQPVQAGQPTCMRCRGRLICSVVNLCDPLPEREFAEALKHAGVCDLFLALGSPLTAWPTHLLPGMAIEGGAKLVLIHSEKTPFDEGADHRIWAEIDRILPAAVERVKELLGYGNEELERKRA